MFSIITFGASLIVIIIILIYQNKQIKEGKIAPVVADSFLDWPSFQNKFRNWLSNFSRQIITIVLRISIKISFFLREGRGFRQKKWAIVKQKIAKFIERKKNTGPVSEFLETIGQYKAKIKQIKKEIEIEEKENINK